MIKSNPPLLHNYVRLSSCHSAERCKLHLVDDHENAYREECKLPLIDLSQLTSEDESQRVECAASIARAASEWGFFQVVSHGVSHELFTRMRREQEQFFKSSFEMKATCGLLNNSYRWGNLAAICPKQFSWSEAFHVPLTKISDESCYGDQFSSLREVMVEYASAMQQVANLIAGVLMMSLGEEKGLLEEICNESTCFLRLNRYPPCPLSPGVFGLVPHTDSDFLTILHQDEVGGLQLMKDSKWMAVRPNNDALIVNVGDLFQAWSNDVYRSIEHKVMANAEVERFSIAYFLCPSYDSQIGSHNEPPTYRRFTFREYRDQIQKDVQMFGHKVGLSRFRVRNFCD